MGAATSQQAYEIELDADWDEDFPVWLGNLVTPDEDVADCEAALFLEPPAGAANQTKIRLATTDGDGLLTIVENYIRARVPKAVINTLSVQGYQLSLRLDHPGGYLEPLLRMAVNVVPFGARRK